MDNFKKLIKEAYLGNPLDEDRKAIEYIKSISDPEEREAEKKKKTATKKRQKAAKK